MGALASKARGLIQDMREKSSEEIREEQKARMKQQVDEFNDREGEENEVDGIDCRICRNKGLIEVLSEDGLSSSIRICECRKRRAEKLRADRLLRESGLVEMIESHTFRNFETKEDWQKKIVQHACDYVRDQGNKWFFFGGQPGAGKTHICTAICRMFLKKSIPVRYLLWKDESAKLKGLINDADRYEEEMKSIKEIPVLYIDDLFKVQRGMKPSQADVNLAFEIINARYNRSELKTIISCEWTMTELIGLDEALGSRIKERRREYVYGINRDMNKNYRIKGYEEEVI